MTDADLSPGRPVRRLAAALVLLPLLLLPVSCGDALPRDDGAVWGDGTWHGTMDTLEDSTVVVRNPREGIWTEEQAWRIEEELRIGRATGDGPEVFGDIWALAVDGWGRMFVYDNQAHEIRLFDRRGRHVRSFGRKGEGPGEFAWVTGLDLSPGGRLLAVDYINARYTLFDTAGTFIRAGRRSYRVESRVPWPGGYDRRGRLWGVGGKSGHFGATSRLVVLDSAFEEKRTVRFPDLGLPEALEAPGAIWALDSEGHLWFGRDDRFRLYRRTPRGDTVRIVEREVSPEGRSDDEKEEARRAAERRMRKAGRDPASLPHEVHDWKPLMQALWIGGGGRLWIAAPSRDETRSVSRLMVFDDGGRFLGVARSDFGIRTPSPTPVFRDGRVHAVTEGKLGVQYLVRGEIVRPDEE